MSRAKTRLVAPLTGFFVLLCVTCALAPIGFVAAAACSVTQVVTSCSKSGECGTSGTQGSQPSSSQRRSGDCKSCTPTGCGFVVEKREAEMAPSSRRAETGHVRIALVSTAATRVASVAASPPLHVLLATFRN